jgi:hypothetical protein
VSSKLIFSNNDNNTEDKMVSLKHLVLLISIMSILGIAQASNPDEDPPRSILLQFNQPNTGVTFDGLSGIESWGQWSEKQFVTMTFDQPLPARFILILYAQAFDRNTQCDSVLFVGKKGMPFPLPKPSTVSFDVHNTDNVNLLTFQVPYPTAPRDVPDAGDDTRPIGIGFMQLLIQEVKSIPPIPYGCMLPYGGFFDPPGWFICDGRTLDCISAPELYNAIGQRYTDQTQVNNPSQFTIPDLRSCALLGIDNTLDSKAPCQILGAVVGTGANVTPQPQQNQPAYVGVNYIIKY